MDIRESELPGIGKKYNLRARSGDNLVIIVHNDERRELFHLDPDNPDESLSMITLDDDEARSAASIIAGMTYKPKYVDNQEVQLDDLLIEWVRLEPHSRCIGKQIGELDIRGATGATILAAVGGKDKQKQKRINPGPEYVLAAGITLVVAGERAQLKALKQMLGETGP